MKKLLILPLLLASTAYAQKVNYTMVFNDPLKLDPFKLYLDALAFDAAIGAGIHANYYLTPKMRLEAIGRYGYLYGGKKEENRANTGDLPAPFYAEAGGQFYLTEKLKKKDKKYAVTVSQSGSSKTTLPLRVKVGMARGVRGGLFLYRNNAVGATDNPFETKNGPISDPEKSLFTPFTSTGIYAGYARRKTKKVKVDISSYGTRRGYLCSTFFVDFMTGTTGFKDVVYQGVTYDVNESPKAPLGYRIGWEIEELGTNVRLEAGLRPGFLAFAGVFDNAPINYMMLSMGFTIVGGEQHQP